MERPNRASAAGHRNYTPPLMLIAVLSAAFGLSLLFQDQSPVVSQINPRVGNPGEVMVIDGSYFGDDRTRATVLISGQRVTASAILEWSPQRISLRIPDEVKSGSVIVQTPAGRSKAQAFTSQNQIPRISQTTQSPISASLVSSQPMFAWPGDPVLIRGRNLGLHRGSLELLVDGEVVNDTNILDWSDSRILLSMPMQASQAVLKLRSSQGLSNALSVPIERGPSYLTVDSEEARYDVELLFDIGDIELGGNASWGRVNVYMPNPPALLGQKVESFQAEGGPHRLLPPNMVAFSIENPTSELSYRLVTKARLSRKPIRLVVGTIPETGYERYEALVERWAASTPMVPLGDPSLKAFVKTTLQNETKPFAKARLLYDAVIDRLSLDPSAGMAFAPQALADRRAASFGYANLYVSALRTAGIPAQLIEGLLVTGAARNKAESHLWVEFFIPTIGWIQADPAMGDGLHPELAAQVGDPASYYFGNLDNRHLALIEGEAMTSLTRLDGNSQKLFQRLILMRVHAESSGNIESYGLFIAPPTVRPGV